MERTMANDVELGQRVHKRLTALGLETPMLPIGERPLHMGNRQENLYSTTAMGFKHIMLAMGLDLGDDSLRETPARVAKMFAHEIFTGLDYDNFPKATTVENKMGYDEMVCSNKITVQSVCEHHFQPFIGHASVAYIPGGKVLGLSKFNRIVDFFARRPQIQERLTEQISAALRLILDTEDVAVVIRAEHFCVRLRGVQDACSDTVTSKLCGRFKTVDPLRAEFLALARGVK